MRARVVIIVEVTSQGLAQLILTDDDQMIETLSANRADYAFGVWILEGRSRHGDHFFNLHPLHSKLERKKNENWEALLLSSDWITP